MYARLQTISGVPDIEGAAALREKAMGVIAGHPGFGGLYAMDRFGGKGRAAFTLWTDEEDARLASNRTAQALGPRPFALETDQIYEVGRRWTGGAAHQEPAAAVVLYFDGPLAAPIVEAAERAERDRVVPAISGHPGLVRGFRLWDPQARAITVIQLATSMDALDDLGRVIGSTVLLPGEDEALLPGPDRAVLYRVVEHRP